MYTLQGSRPISTCILLIRDGVTWCSNSMLCFGNIICWIYTYKVKNLPMGDASLIHTNTWLACSLSLMSCSCKCRKWQLTHQLNWGLSLKKLRYFIQDLCLEYLNFQWSNNACVFLSNLVFCSVFDVVLATFQASYLNEQVLILHLFYIFWLSSYMCITYRSLEHLIG